MDKIDKGVPIPPDKSHPARYPWGDLEIGDSFFVANRRADFFGTALYRAEKRFGFTYTRRSVVENGVKGTRIWRVS